MRLANKAFYIGLDQHWKRAGLPHHRRRDLVSTPFTMRLMGWQSTAYYYARVMAFWNIMRPRLSVPCLDLRYEAAVRSFEPTFRSVFNFLGLDWDPAVTEFHKRASGKFIASPSHHQVAQPLYDTSIGRWQRYASEFTSVASTLEPYLSSDDH